jgi:DNA processing protein
MTPRDDLACYLALNLCPGIGPATIQRIISDCPYSISELFTLSRATLSELAFKPQQLSYLSNPDWEAVEQALEWQTSEPNHHIITQLDPAYPDLLKDISDAPPLLYAIGDKDLLQTPQIAVVGSRNCTPGGADTAEEFSRYLCRAGLTITSGMALGIDQHAHSAALSCKGKTIAVIGTGIDRIYPSKNKQLAYEIAENGLIVSEFPLGTPPLNSNFPKRNRIISGLSLAILVVEATRKSGSLITARLGLEQGREVFAIPGSIHNPQSKGCHHLIRQGAKLVDQASDIIDDIGSLLGYIAEQVETQHVSQTTPTLGSEYQSLLDAMGYDPVSMDTLVNRSGLTIDQLSSMLLILELNDQIKTAPGGFYVRC